MFVGHGFTGGCPGCESLIKEDGIRRGGHNPECRARVEEILKQTPEGRARLDRASHKATEYLEKALQRENARANTEEESVPPASNGAAGTTADGAVPAPTGREDEDAAEEPPAKKSRPGDEETREVIGQNADVGEMTAGRPGRSADGAMTAAAPEEPTEEGEEPAGKRRRQNDAISMLRAAREETRQAHMLVAANLDRVTQWVAGTWDIRPSTAKGIVGGSISEHERLQLQESRR